MIWALTPLEFSSEVILHTSVFDEIDLGSFIEALLSALLLDLSVGVFMISRQSSLVM